MGNKRRVFEKHLGEMEIRIPRFTGNGNGLDFLDQPDSWEVSTPLEEMAAKGACLEIALSITPEMARGKNFAALVAEEAARRGLVDAEHMARTIAGTAQYVRADLVA